MNREYNDPKPENIIWILTQLRQLKQMIIDELAIIQEDEEGSDEEAYVELDDL